MSRIALAFVLATGLVAAQPIYVPDNMTSVGTCNVIPFGQSATFSAGYTYIGRVPASFLTPGLVVFDVAFTPCGSGTWSSSNVLIGMGHVPNPQPCPFTFPGPGGAPIGSFIDFTVLYDSAVAGPFTWNVTQDMWSPMNIPTLTGASFAWDGINDVAFYVTFQNSTVTWNGAFHRTSTEPARSYSSGYQAPTSTACLSAAGLKMCLNPVPPFTITATTTGAGDLTVGLLNIPAMTFEGYTFFSMDTSGPVGSGGFFGLIPDLNTLVSLTLPAGPGNPFHWTWPVPAPLYPASPISAGPGSFMSGVTLDFMGLAITAAGPWEATSNIQRLTF